LFLFARIWLRYHVAILLKYQLQSTHCESKNPIILSDILQNDMSIDKNLMLLSNKLMSHRIEVVKDKSNKELPQNDQQVFLILSGGGSL
jgi:biotin synthase-related radical SAM superfamily protein